jgi:acyl-coenzyme A synthetase/AMP-(fatty) acid ligase
MKDPISYENGDSICRVVFTSGTTGKRKALALSVDQIQSRALNYGVRTSFGTEINLMMLSTYGGFNIAFSNLIKGRPNFFFKGPGQLLRILEKFNIGLLGGSPIQISKFIEFLKAKDKKLKVNAVRCGGAAISKKLLEDIRVYLSKEVINTYSSTEVGSVCIYPIREELQFNVAGFVLPDVDIQILGDNKEPLGFNEEGIIRIRTPYMANKYFQSTEFNYLFEDGWFYPGDMGKLDSKGLLTLSGRSDEVINRGGVKIDPSSIDDYLSSQSGVKDVATFKVIANQGDIKLLSILVVEDKLTFDIEVLKNNFLKTLGNARIPDKFELVDEIPRNSMGKTPRKELSDKYQHLFN